MGMTDKQFKSHIRSLIRDLKDIKEKPSKEEKDELVDSLLTDLQAALED